MKFEKSSVLLALSMYPYSKEFEYINMVKSNMETLRAKRLKYFRDDKFLDKENISNDEYPYFNPLIYHLFGKFDVAFLTLVDNLSITSKPFFSFANNGTEGKTVEEKTYNFIKSQIISGIIPSVLDNAKSEFKEKFDRIGLKKCISITNFKLNNGFLIGTGYVYFEYVYHRIVKILDQYHSNLDYIIIDSFGSYEITLLLFNDDISELADIIQVLREMGFSCDPDSLPIKNSSKIVESIVRDCIYNKMKPKDTDEAGFIKKLNSSYLFTDSQTYFGFKIEKNKALERYCLPNINRETKLESTIEWHVRPGHFAELKKYIFTNTKLRDKFDKSKIYFIPGKTDYIFEESSNLYSAIAEIYEQLRDENSNLKSHIRKIETKLLFECSNLNDDSEDNAEISKTREASPPYSRPYLAILANQNINHEEINAQLKALKVSRIVRHRILKIFVSYSNMIRMPVAYNLFIDFRYFIEDLSKFISQSYSQLAAYYDETSPDFIVDQKGIYEKDLELNDLEEILLKYIVIFEDAFYLRYINNYNIEESSEYFISYNSSVQQIISAFDNYFKILGTRLLGGNNKVLITRVNGVQTVATRLNVNFSIYNLYEPSALFALAGKEVVTVMLKNEHYNSIISGFNGTIKDYWNGYFSEYFNFDIKLHQEFILDYNNTYFLADIVRLYYFFNRDFKTYYYYHWVILLQVPSAYDISGNFNKSVLMRELYRVWVVAALFDKLEPNNKPDEDENWLNYCCSRIPSPELGQNWIYFRTTLKESIETFVNEFLLAKVRDFIHLPINKLLFNSQEIFKERDISIIQTNISSELFEWDEYIATQTSLMTDVQQNREEEKYEEILRVFSYATMQFIANANKYKPETLKRSWKTGVPFVESSGEGLFLLDGEGGVWFHSFTNLMEYNITRNSIFLFLKHISLRYKKILMEPI